MRILSTFITQITVTVKHRNAVLLSKNVIVSANECINILQNTITIGKIFDVFVVMVSALGVKTIVKFSTEMWLRLIATNNGLKYKVIKN